MAGLQAFMSVCQAMEGSLPDEDKALLGTMHTIQNRMAQRTVVEADGDADDADMEEPAGGGKSSRQESDVGKLAKKQCTDANGTGGSAKIVPEAGISTTGSTGSGGLAGVSQVPGHVLS